MRAKHGFTLSELLVVLVVIGAIAILTLPNLQKGQRLAQMRTALKKSYTNISNIMLKADAEDVLPTDTKQPEDLFKILEENLYVKGYLSGSISSRTKRLIIPKPQNTRSGNVTPVSYDSTSLNTLIWMLTNDGTSYAVTTGSACDSIENIDKKSKFSEAANASCFVIYVDVDGILTGPNTSCTDSSSSSSISSILACDRFAIFVGNDGATVGAADANPASGMINDKSEGDILNYNK